MLTIGFSIPTNSLNPHPLSVLCIATVLHAGDVTGPNIFLIISDDELFGFVAEQAAAEKPMFIWWAPLVPHTPHNPPERLLAKFKDAEVPVPSYIPTENHERFKQATRKFWAMGTWLDEGVAELIAKLKSVGEYENTLFIFYVDNGWAIGCYAKNSAFEKGLRTPMILSWPDRIPAGKRINDPHYALDLHATILDYAGLEPTPGIVSRTLRPVIEGNSGRRHEALFGTAFAHHNYDYKGPVPRTPNRDLIALYIREDKWKFIYYPQSLGKNNDRYFRMDRMLLPDPIERAAGDVDLFDLENDPYEMHNLANDPAHASRIAAMERRVFDWWKETNGKSLSE